MTVHRDRLLTPAGAYAMLHRKTVTESAKDISRKPDTIALLQRKMRDAMYAHLDKQFIENKTFDEIEIGQHARLVRTLKPDDIHLFAVMSGDVNPTHVDPDFARSGQFREVVGHSM